MRRFRNVPALAGVLLFLFVAICPVWGGSANTSAQTFILSNEGSNGLITQLVNAGYGNYNVYDAVVAIQQNGNPAPVGVLSPAFFLALAANPASSQIFNTTLGNWNSPGTAIAISTDGTVQAVGIFGASYQGASGITTLVSNIVGVGKAKFLSGTITSFSSGGTTYNVFGIAFSGEQTFVLSNEGTNGLITQLINAGYGNVNLYQSLVAIQQNTNPSVAGIVTDAFIEVLASLPASSQIFTTPLKNFSVGSQALAISTDGTVQTITISGAGYDNGTNTLGATISGVGTGYFTHSTSAGTYLTSFTSGGTSYNVFGIAWLPSQTTTVPTLSQWGLILLAGLLAGVAAFALHRTTRRASAELS